MYSFKPPKQPAKRYCIWLLSKKEWSASDLAKRLTLKGYDSVEIQNCLDYLKLNNFQSDERFAKSKAKILSKSKSNYFVKKYLEQSKIDDDTIDEALTNLESEYDRALKVSQKLVSSEKTNEIKSKLIKKLYSKGFSQDTIKKVIKEFFNI